MFYMYQLYFTRALNMIDNCFVAPLQNYNPSSPFIFLRKDKISMPRSSVDYCDISNFLFYCLSHHRKPTPMKWYWEFLQIFFLFSDHLSFQWFYFLITSFISIYSDPPPSLLFFHFCIFKINESLSDYYC